jgi:succinate dehydrogenase/fumarate reductase-like Fe-S protein
MAERKQETITVNVRRYNPVEGNDGGLSHYVSCRRGICGECTVKVNGRPKLACMEMVTGDITLDPISEGRVIKDLICLHSK